VQTITISQIKKHLLSYREECQIASKVDEQVKSFGYYKDAKNELDRLSFEMRYTSGQLINYPPYGVLAKQPLLSNYYRGERCLYGNSKPTIHRNVPEGKQEQLLHYFIANMRIVAFNEFIKQLDLVKNWKWSVILFEALAQHYGIATDFLDITNDLEVALFFACCKFENGKWRVLNKNDFVDEKSKHGVLFKVSSDTFYGSNRLLPIGFQPLMRCHRQHAYILSMDSHEDLYFDKQFAAYIFEHDEDFCNEIFELSEMGKRIFPNYESMLLTEAISNINNAKYFSEKVFDSTYSFIYNFRYIEYNVGKNELLFLLNKNGIEIKEISLVDDAIINQINTLLFPYINNNEGLKTVFRTALFME